MRRRVGQNFPKIGYTLCIQFMATGDYSSSTFECKLSRKNDTPKSIFFFLCDCDVEKNRDKSLVFYHVYSGPSLTPAQPARSRRYILRTPLEKFTQKMKNSQLLHKRIFFSRRYFQNPNDGPDCTQSFFSFIFD